MDWQLNSAKSRLWANTAALRRWLAAEGGGVPASTSFKDLGGSCPCRPGQAGACRRRAHQGCDGPVFAVGPVARAVQGAVHDGRGCRYRGRYVRSRLRGAARG
eukprot:8295867-Lingulodinium_polyedra.AAC.1